MKELLKKHIFSFLLILLLFIASFMRFYGSCYSLGNDELSELVRARDNSFSDIIHYRIFEDVHPAGKLIFTHCWIKYFGDSEFSLRFPYIIAGILSVLLIYLTGAKWFGRTAGLFAAAAMTFLEYPLLYSQYARTYSSGLLFTLTTAWLWTRILFNNEKEPVIKKIFTGAGFALAAAACMYNHYFSFLFALIVLASGLLFLNKFNYKHYLLSCFFILLLFSPHIPVTLAHFGKEGLSSWLGKPGTDAFINYLLQIFNNSWVMLSVFAFIPVALLWKNRHQFKVTRFHYLALAWFLLPFLIIFLYSVFKSPVLQNSGLIFSFPYLLLLIFSFIPDRINLKIVLFLFIFIAAGIFHTVIIKKYYRQFHFESFRELAVKIKDYQNKYGNKNITFTTVVNNIKYFGFYFSRLNMNVRFAQSYNVNGNDIRQLKNILDTSQTKYFVNSQTLPGKDETDALIRSYYPCMIDNNHYGQNTFIRLYSKDTTCDCMPAEAPDTSVTVFFNQKRCSVIYAGSKDFHISGTLAVMLDSLTEFGPGYVNTLGNIDIGKISKIRISVRSEILDTISNIHLVAEIKTADPERNVWSSSILKNFLNPEEPGEAFLTVLVPASYSEKDTLKVYMWNPDKKTARYDRITIGFYH